MGEAVAPGRLAHGRCGAYQNARASADRRKRWAQTARTGFSEEEFAAAYENMRSTFAYIEKALADSPWLAGDIFTLADIAIAPFVERIIELRPETLDEVVGASRLHDWFARMQKRPSWQEAFFFQGMDASTRAAQAKIAASLGETAA